MRITLKRAIAAAFTLCTLGGSAAGMAATAGASASPAAVYFHSSQHATPDVYFHS